jgi:hypothetical protein
MATAAVSANKAELIAIADAVAREKLIDRMIVIEAMEDAIQRAARARYGAENDIRAKLDPTTGDLRLWRVLEVVEEPEDHFKQIDVKGAQKLQKGASVGDFIVDPLPPIEFGRIAAQAAKQVIFQKVRDAERERQYEEFKDRVGEIISRRLSEVLDEKDPIEGSYRLEVSSPGIDRPLTRLADYDDWKGHEARVTLAEPLNGRKQFSGTLLGTGEGGVVHLSGKDGQDYVLPFASIASAKLLLTDKLINATAPLRTEGADTIQTVED